MKTLLNTQIFLVEDDPIYADMLKNHLSGIGFTNVTHFLTGHECLDHLYQNPGLIILDYQLEYETGIDVLKQVKAYNSDIPIVFLSGQKNVTIAVDSLKYGSYDYVVKDDSAFTQLQHAMMKIERMQTMTQKASSFSWIKNAFSLKLPAH